MSNTQLDNLPFSYAKVSEEGNIITFNSLFKKEFILDKKEMNIHNISEEINLDISEQRILINKKFYFIFIKKIVENNSNIYELFFYNTTLEESQKPVVGLILIDNYEEVLDTLEDFRHPIITAIVDRKINKFVKDMGGIVKKFEKDKYIFVSSNDKLNEAKINRFNILESIREIDIGNSLPVTLSIGVGVNGVSLDENMDFARVSIDLALSRGGDQAVIKDADNYIFFGGHSKEIGKNSRVRARVKAYAFKELIEEASNVIIMGHKNADLDCLGSGVGVYSIVSSFEKPCKILLNSTSSAISSMFNKLIKDEKYSNVFISSQEALKLINRKTLLVVVDTSKGSICECPELIDKIKKVVIFDHHRKGIESIEKAVLSYHEPSCSSTCELITEMLMYINKPINVKNVEADAILAGIIVDTKNFAFKTGVKTFEAAAFLKKKGADTVRVKSLFKDTLENYKAKSEVVQNAEIFNETMAIATLQKEVSNPILTIAQSADDLLLIENINASFVLYQQNNDVYISARSFGEVNVQIIMEILGGGGHQSMSASQVKNATIDEAKIILKDAINYYLKEEN